jgi:signal transduction histidine kinase
MTQTDDARLAQLVGVRGSKTGYYARWRGTAADLKRALAGWSEAERRADELVRRNEQIRRAREHLARVRQAEMVSAERHRIARDLHDSVAQSLVGIGMHLEWCQRHTDPDAPGYDRLVASKELARAGLGWVRSAVGELSGLEQPGTGLGQALRDLAADFRAARLLRVSVRVSGDQRQLPTAVEHSLFQISQEGLWNVVRHAEASRAWLSLAYGDGQVRLSVADDGSSDPALAARYLAARSPTAGEAGRHGLRNMAERTAELDGVIRARRRRGGGLRITVSVPVPPPHQAAAADTAAP